MGKTNLRNLSTDHLSQNQFITIGEEKIFYTQKGEGKDILLIHGMPGSHQDWKLIIDSLAKEYRVTAFDRPGHGYSTSNAYNCQLKENAILVENLILQLHLKNPLIVGHSYGGSIAANLAKYSLQTGLRYVIIDSPLYGYQVKRIKKLPVIPFIGKGLTVIASYTIVNKNIANDVALQFKSTSQEQIKDYILERQHMWSQPKVLFTLSNEATQLAETLKFMATDYHQIQAPVTIISSTDSVNTFRNDYIRFHYTVADSKLLLWKNTGQYIQLERANKLIGEIRKLMVE